LDQLESLDLLALLDAVSYTLPTDDVAVRIQALDATLVLASITLDEIRQVQAAEDSLQPVLQFLKDQVKQPHSGLCQYS